MSVNILEVLMNAELNLGNVPKIGHPTVDTMISIAKAQLHNGIQLLEKGYPAKANFDDLVEEYGNIENVPDIREDD
jgi:hypothetical protein